MLHLPWRRRRDLLRLVEGLMRLSIIGMGHVLRMRSWRMVGVCAIAVMLLRVLLRMLLRMLLRVLLKVLLRVLLRMEVVRMMRWCLRLRIVRHWLQGLHLMVWRRLELAIRLVLVVAHIGHRVCVPISILLLVSRLRRHLGQAIIGLSRRLRAPIVVVVHGDDIW